MRLIYGIAVTMQAVFFRLRRIYLRLSCGMLMEQLPDICKMPPEWVAIVPAQRGVRYRCPQAVKAMMSLRVKGKAKLGAEGIAAYIGVSPRTVYDWSCKKTVHSSDFMSLCRLWNEHHE